MNKTYLYIFLAWIFISGSSAGCGSNNGDPTPQSGIDGTWKLTKVNGQQTILTDPKKGTTYTTYYDGMAAEDVSQGLKLVFSGGSSVTGFMNPVLLVGSGKYELGGGGSLSLTLNNYPSGNVALPNGKVFKFFGQYKISGNQLIITQNQSDFVASVIASSSTSIKDLQTYDLTLTYTRQ